MRKFFLDTESVWQRTTVCWGPIPGPLERSYSLARFGPSSEQIGGREWPPAQESLNIFRISRMPEFRRMSSHSKWTCGSTSCMCDLGRLFPRVSHALCVDSGSVPEAVRPAFPNFPANPIWPTRFSPRRFVVLRERSSVCNNVAKTGPVA